MSVAYELKQKRATLAERLQQLERERTDIQELMGALDLVILSYQPDYQPPESIGGESDGQRACHYAASAAAILRNSGIIRGSSGSTNSEEISFT